MTQAKTRNDQGLDVADQLEVYAAAGSKVILPATLARRLSRSIRRSRADAERCQHFLAAAEERLAEARRLERRAALASRINGWAGLALFISAALCIYLT